MPDKSPLDSPIKLTRLRTTNYARPEAVPPGPLLTKQSATKSKRSQHIRFPWQSTLYQLSFTFFILLIAALLVASAWGIGEQALRTAGGQKKWNIVVLVAAYVALAVSAVIHLWSRLLSVKKVIRTMPKPYMPTKAIDVPKVSAYLDDRKS